MIKLQNIVNNYLIVPFFWTRSNFSLKNIAILNKIDIV